MLRIVCVIRRQISTDVCTVSCVEEATGSYIARITCVLADRAADSGTDQCRDFGENARTRARARVCVRGG